MKTADIYKHRLVNQHIAAHDLATPQEVVSTLTAMQAQEYAHAKYAIGLRSEGLTDAMVEDAFNKGAILRTHVMRPTWHFVSPGDIRWLQMLTSHRVQAFSAPYYRKTELDTKTLNKATGIIISALENGHFKTRDELRALLKKAKIKVTGDDGMRITLILIYAELECMICSGPRQGRQFTYALLDEKVPAQKPMHREEALLKLVAQYFATRGPATLQDFAWWSGLTIKDAREGVAQLGSRFKTATIEGKTYVYTAAEQSLEKHHRSSFLMPAYDEYGIAYKDRTAILPPAAGSRAKGYTHSLVLNGKIAGSWKPVVKKDTISVLTHFFDPLNKTREQLVGKAIRHYAHFTGLQLVS